MVMDDGSPSKSFTVSTPSNILLGGMVSALAASAKDTSPRRQQLEQRQHCSFRTQSVHARRLRLWHAGPASRC